MQRMEKLKGWRIYHENGTYFSRNTDAGPSFGSTREKAASFPTSVAAQVMVSCWPFAKCEVESPSGKRRK